MNYRKKPLLDRFAHWLMNYKWLYPIVARLVLWKRAYKRRQFDRQVFTPLNMDSTSVVKHISPCGKYELMIARYTTTPASGSKNSWSYSRGTVTNLATSKVVGDVKRNYSQFPFCWVVPTVEIPGHPNGHDYLVCGADYQGQTCLELDTGKRADYLPREAVDGFGFCWAAISYEPDGFSTGAASYEATGFISGPELKVSGCVWGGPYDLVWYDFNKPLKMPYNELHSEPEPYEDEEDA